MPRDHELVNALKWMLYAAKNGKFTMSRNDKSQIYIQWGICQNLTRFFVVGLDQEQTWAIWDKVGRTLSNWPKFSGDLKYPIPSPFNYLNAEGFYYEYARWLDAGLALRIEALEWLIKELENGSA